MRKLLKIARPGIPTGLLILKTKMTGNYGKIDTQAFEKTSTPFCPPKPKELEIAAPIFTARA